MGLLAAKFGMLEASKQLLVPLECGREELRRMDEAVQTYFISNVACTEGGVVWWKVDARSQARYNITIILQVRLRGAATYVSSAAQNNGPCTQTQLLVNAEDSAQHTKLSWEKLS
jgi:hypothetical protein